MEEEDWFSDAREEVSSDEFVQPTGDLDLRTTNKMMPDENPQITKPHMNIPVLDVDACVAYPNDNGGRNGHGRGCNGNGCNDHGHIRGCNVYGRGHIRLSGPIPRMQVGRGRGGGSFIRSADTPPRMQVGRDRGGGSSINQKGNSFCLKRKRVYEPEYWPYLRRKTEHERALARVRGLGRQDESSSTTKRQVSNTIWDGPLLGSSCSSNGYTTDESDDDSDDDSDDEHNDDIVEVINISDDEADESDNYSDKSDDDSNNSDESDDDSESDDEYDDDSDEESEINEVAQDVPTKSENEEIFRGYEALRSEMANSTSSSD